MRPCGAKASREVLAPAHAPATVLPEWLAGQYKDAAKGDLVLVDYKYDDVDP